MKKNTYTIICSNCGAQYKHFRKARVCTTPGCGNIAKLPVFDDEQVEEILNNDGDKPLPEVNVKSDEKHRDREPEDGGPVM